MDFERLEIKNLKINNQQEAEIITSVINHYIENKSSELVVGKVPFKAIVLFEKGSFYLDYKIEGLCLTKIKSIFEENKIELPKNSNDETYFRFYEMQERKKANLFLERLPYILNEYKQFNRSYKKDWKSGDLLSLYLETN